MPPRAPLVLALLLSGCGILGLEDDQDRALDLLERSRSRWSDRAPGRYGFVLERFCFCPLEAIGPVQVIVEHGVVISRTYVESGLPVPEQWRPLFPAMEGVFAVVRDALVRDADKVEVSYDGQLGYPLIASIDYVRNAVDDELELRVRSFETR
jgi:hypothetical protein